MGSIDYTPIRSPLGAFYRSTRGVRYHRLPQSMTMLFIEDSKVYLGWPAEEAWYPDVARWDKLISKYGYPKWGAVVCEVEGEDPESPWGDIMPPGASMPAGMAYQQMGRPPSLADFISIYKANYVGGDLRPFPPLLTLIIGYWLPSLGPGLFEFRAWLDNGGTSEPDPENPLQPIPWRQFSLDHTIWLRPMCDNVYTGET
ncbi:MAG: hypothetical protein LBT97_03770 [Planctomycetota bacterium]|jgi:hypothetical protein|nr:hypothetical protein [Planctomycetota bacterium]